jgi:hypothetical protein
MNDSAFPFGARGVGPGVAPGDLELRAGRPPGPGAVGVPVVAEDALDTDAVLLGEPGHGAAKEGAGGLGALTGEHLAVGQARVIVDGHVQVVPAGGAGAADAVAKDALAHLVEAPQALGVHVQELARTLALIAARRQAGGTGQARLAVAAQDLAHARGGTAQDGPQAQGAELAARAQGEDSVSIGSASRRGWRRGTGRRSLSPSQPSASKRLSSR